MRTRPIARAALLAAVSLLLAAPVCSQTLREEASLLDKPDGAPQGARLKSATPLKLQKRQGFWVEVEASGRSGWLKVSAVSFAGASGPVAIDTGRLGQGNIVATSAARGLSAKDLLEGKPNLEEAVRLEALAIDASGVAAFRSQGGVQPQSQVSALAVARAGAAANSAPNQASGNAASHSPAAVSAGTPVGTSGTAKKKGDDDW